jgi:hypothetical protein
MADLSAELAVRSHDGVWAIARGRAASLPTNEARGYLRARARHIVGRQAGIVFGAHPSTRDAVREQVVVTALEHVVAMVMRELASSPIRDERSRSAA